MRRAIPKNNPVQEKREKKIAQCELRKKYIEWPLKFLHNLNLEKFLLGQKTLPLLLFQNLINIPKLTGLTKLQIHVEFSLRSSMLFFVVFDNVTLPIFPICRIARIRNKNVEWKTGGASDGTQKNVSILFFVLKAS